ncbi:MAG: hypothetical protein H6622_12470 [Halobacteriovoraceae bacterium]|nr:hypothetical protein [Halobacteriovoraceae bacterium]
MRDATDSWSGYLYQSIIGLIVAMENIVDSQSQNLTVQGELVYEDFEDFSIYLKDESNQPLSSRTYQVKFKKSTTPSDYYPVFRDLVRRSEENPTLEYFLNISNNIDFTEVDHERSNLPENFFSMVYNYRNDQSYLGGVEALSYLEELISNYAQNADLNFTRSKVERAASFLISYIDKMIIRTKDMRATNVEYREVIQIQTLIDHIINTPDEISEEIAAQIIRTRVLNAFYMFSESFEDEEVVTLERFITSISKVSDKELISFTKKIEIHKDLTSLTELISAFKNPEDLQDVLMEAIKGITSEIDIDKVIFRKDNTAYRPSSMRMSNNERTAQQNLRMQYIPLIKRNMSLYDVEGYFQTKKIIISGNTVPNIWEYIITASHSEKKENKINEPELKTLISITEAIEEINDDD